MGLLTGVSSFFGLDIGTTAVRVVELTGSGPVKTLARYAYVPIDQRVALSDSATDQAAIARIIHDLLLEARITTKNVAVGLPSQRVFTAVVDIERLSPSELARSIQLQADSIIPTPLNESKIDWSLLGDAPSDSAKVEILLSSVPNELVEKRLDMLEGIGLNVIAFEPENLALARAVFAPDATLPQMVVDIGNKSTDLVISFNGAPRITRSVPTGADAIIKAATQNLSIDRKQAEQFVYKFGMSKDKLEGQVVGAISSTVELLVNEIDKSIKFFATRYSQTAFDRIIVTGAAATLPELPLYLANRFGLNVEIGNAWRNVAFRPDQQNDLLAISNHFSVAVGLAERME